MWPVSGLCISPVVHNSSCFYFYPGFNHEWNQEKPQSDFLPFPLMWHEWHLYICPFGLHDFVKFSLRNACAFWQKGARNSKNDMLCSCASVCGCLLVLVGDWGNMECLHQNIQLTFSALKQYVITLLQRNNSEIECADRGQGSVVQLTMTNIYL